jgi:RNA polymerase sigma-70 factor (ECF subfamily)
MPPTARDPTTSGSSEDGQRFIEIVEQARAGDKTAFDTLFQHYNARICTYLAHMVGDEEEGRDLAQETFLKAWQCLANLHNEAYFDAWLYRIATNIAIDHLRRRKFRWSYLKTDENEDMSTAGPEERIVEMELIQQALAKVSLKYRTCLLLQLVANFSQREIATALKISEKSVSIYVSRGIEQFRLAYQRLSWTNEPVLKEGDKAHARIYPHALYRLGTETSG